MKDIHEHSSETGEPLRTGVGWAGNGERKPDDVEDARPPLPTLVQKLKERTSTLSLTELELEPKPVRCLWGHYIVAGEVNLVVGAGGVGKTSAFTGFGVARASGQRFLGKTVPEGHTVIFTTEDSVAAYLRKLHAWRTIYSTWREAAGRIHIVDLKGIPLHLVAADHGRSEVMEDVVQAMAEHVLQLVPGGDAVVMLETVSRLSAGDEGNSGGGMLVVALERLSLLTGGCTPLAFVHTGKGNARDRVVDQYASRNASALPDNARSVMVLSRVPEDVLKRAGLEEMDSENLLGIFHAKHNYTPKEPDLLIRREGSRHAAYFETISKKQVTVEDLVSPEQSEANHRAEMGERIRNVVRHAVEVDGCQAVTSTVLRDEYRDKLGLPKNKVAGAVTRALKDGWVAEVVTVKLKGGHHPLVPGPRPQK